MNRPELTCKAKRIDNGEWVEGYYGIKGEGTDIEVHVIMQSTLGNGSGTYFYFTDIDVDPTTISMCTGLIDKHGKLIYENDRLLTDDSNWGYGGDYDKKNDGYLRLTVPSIVELLNDESNFDYEPSQFKYMEVIGNAHDGE